MKYLNRTSAIGENTSDNQFDSSNVVSNKDGSVLERLETCQIGLSKTFQEQPDVPVNISVADSIVNILYLHAENTRYILRELYLKSEDPGAETITISLKKLINDVATVIDTFSITTGNHGTYFGLSDMFGAEEIVGDSIQIYAQSSGTSSVTIIGQYSYAKTNN